MFDSLPLRRRPEHRRAFGLLTVLELSEISFFSTLSPTALEAVRDLTETRNFAAGAVVCRRGAPGEAFHAVARGAVTIGLSASNAGRPQFYLGPGEVFGEMSLLSDMPVSAMVIAAEETCTYALPKPSFLLALETHPPLRAALADMLVRRMRHRTATSSSEIAVPGCVMVELSSDSPALRSLGRAIGRGVQHYAPGSSVVDPTEWSTDGPHVAKIPAGAKTNLVLGV